MFNEQEYLRRQTDFFKQLPTKSVAILVGAKEAIRNGDAEYPYRQDSDFFYLTGFIEPGAIAVFLKDNKSTQYILFSREKNPEIEKWTGEHVGQQNACKVFKADLAFPINTFFTKLPELLNGRDKVFYRLGKNRDVDDQLIAIVKDLNTKSRSGVTAPEEFINVDVIIHEMRLIKSDYELALMRKAAQISADAHVRAMKKCRPGMKEYELEAELLYEFLRKGARAVAYNSIVGGGANSCILHYVANRAVLEHNQLVLIDAAAEYENYAADITRTFPVNGRFTTEQRAIYELVLTAQIAVIEKIKPGCPWDCLQDTATEIISSGLIELGLLKGKLNDVLAKQSYRHFYMHNIGHWLGLDVHDVGNYKPNGKWRNLEPGMVLTVEPGIYIDSDAKIGNKWKNIGVRIEDDVLVTEEGCEILSHGVPKNPDEVLAIMGN